MVETAYRNDDGEIKSGDIVDEDALTKVYKCEWCGEWKEGPMRTIKLVEEYSIGRVLEETIEKAEVCSECILTPRRKFLRWVRSKFPEVLECRR